MDLLSTPYVFNFEEAKWIAEAEADILVAHKGPTTRRISRARTARTPEECVGAVTPIAEAAKAARGDCLVLAHGGPIATPDDARFILERCPVEGFYGASSMERLPAETAI